MREPDRISEIRLYRVLSNPIYAMAVYRTDSGNLYRIDTLESWEPTEDYELEQTIAGEKAIEMSRAIDKVLHPAGEC